ncbi:cell wall hydrolase [Fuchsiella alkaliacetigena]|uniref:cell wall hydrolase n=1 Tax=Fuchsiella alkaliacetigena TaxID=957042 RepID=UPI00200B7D32|nr:cell wall hydrolase [Fuchsiella alkaliacetigena]MCK8823495.1 cell wall hydrolase [Fuchsiella alkaliacetigena]
MNTKKLNIILILVVLLLLISATNLWAGSEFKIRYKVQSDDALVNIAREFGTTVDRLKEVNNLGNRFIRAGDTIEIPLEYSLESKEDEAEKDAFKVRLLAETYKNDDRGSYTLNKNTYENITIKVDNSSLDNIQVAHLNTLDYNVRPGDTLYDLAREFNTSVAVIRKLNDMDSSDVIRRGDKITLPIDNLTAREVVALTVTEEEKDLLARLIYSEARGEPYTGQVAVGAVVLNRVIDSQFPDNIRDVIYQRGQFTPVSNGHIYRQPDRQAYQAADDALSGKDPSRGALYFYNPDTATTLWWLSTRDTIVKIGNHLFAE